MRRIQTLLIANRGEIARRILRTTRQLGIRGAVVFTDADADLPFVAEADVAVRIGDGPVGTSYLDAAAILDAARRVGADAVHPGYGFFAENAAFAHAVVEAGLIWVGPAPDSIETMGDKATARHLAADHAVPVLPGYDADDQSDDTIIAAAVELGTPLLVKATGGGGGRGLRLVHDLALLPDALAAARREAASAFGSDRVLLERYVDRPRHIEVQVFGDAHGNVIHLGERECSIQRRHQKVVEEAPSPVVSEALRRELGVAACRVAMAVGYIGAGTVEFLLEPDGRFWFLEMNTRLQVEHPVTELITGLDLVALQLRVAEGEPLGITQDQVALSGHAIEVRVYAEDPVRDYLPSTGRIVRLDVPLDARARVDAGYASGNAISPHYDAMVAKIITHGPTRLEASRRLARTLAETWMPGPASNLPLLKQILATPEWLTGDLDTGFLARVGLPTPPPLHVHEGVLAATVAAWSVRRDGGEIPAGWRLTGPTVQRDRWTSFGVEVTATWRALGAEAVAVTVDAVDADHDGTPDDVSVAVRVRVLAHDGDQLSVEVDGVRQRWRVCTADGDPIADGSVVYAHLGNGVEAMVRLEPRHPAPGAEAEDPGTLTAPTPGTVVRVLVAEGAEVTQGQPLVVIEAMKMEHSVSAGRDGTVGAVLVREGDAVADGAVLVRLVEEG